MFISSVDFTSLDSLNEMHGQSFISSQQHFWLWNRIGFISHRSGFVELCAF